MIGNRRITTGHREKTHTTQKHEISKTKSEKIEKIVNEQNNPDSTRNWEHGTQAPMGKASSGMLESQVELHI